MTTLLLAANFGGNGGGSPIDFRGLQGAGANLAGYGIAFGIMVFALLVVILLVTHMTGRASKSDLLGALAISVIGAVGITAVVAWGGSQASAAAAMIH